ncbi:MAG TPA: metallophosphoesterase [Gemmataceae bacterium]|jgi:predicted phosphohydrolase|nr:metallophosphoesterase [Gemmataceae bacterium]
MAPFRLAVTADLHYGTRHTAGNRATHDLVTSLAEQPPDLLILAGDIGAGDDFDRCLALFDDLPCRKALVPGNHDVWVRQYDDRGDSLDVYDRHLPAVAKAHGFAYLDHEPLLFADRGLAVVGTMNWYDYTWDNDLLRDAAPDWEERLRAKRFTRGMHNDANFVRWPLTDLAFTDRVVAKLTADLEAALARVDRAVVVAHHPPLRGLLYPAHEPPPLDALLWRAFSGNTRVEALLTANAARVPLVFCGHTHAARDCEIGPMRGFNVGGDYGWKRLLRVEWPSGAVTAEEFHR